ncbi:two-component regulator propeller domain-containing protein [Desulfobacterales bacterium HSG2]|nr:two-component regulator propeller domain-containing protein [Desulfobacterales bacterium HSG2]
MKTYKKKYEIRKCQRLISEMSPGRVSEHDIVEQAEQTETDYGLNSFVFKLIGICAAFILLFSAVCPITQARATENIRLRKVLSTGVAYNGSIIQDRDGFFWIATQAGLYKYDGSDIRVYNTSNSPMKGARIQAVFEDNDGYIWFATQGAGAYRYDKNTDLFTVYAVEKENSESISGNAFNWSSHLFEQDSEGFVWIGSSNGLNRYDKAEDTFTRYKNKPGTSGSLSNDDVWAVMEDKSGVLWIGTSDGLNKYDKETETFTVYKDGDYKTTTIYALYEDHQGTLWIGTNYNGLAKLDKDAGKFVYYDQAAGSTFNVVNSISEYGGSLWLSHWLDIPGISVFNRETRTFTTYTKESKGFGLEDNGTMHSMADESDRLWVITLSAIHVYDPMALKFEYFSAPSDKPENSIKNVLNMLEDKNGNIWLGTYGHGIFKYEPETDIITQYLNDPKDPASLPSSTATSLLTDSIGNFWVGGEGVLSMVNRETGKVEKTLETPKFALMHLLQDTQDPDVIWGSLLQGGLLRISRQTGEYKYYTNNPSDPDSLGSNFFLHMYQEDDGTFWIATSGGGLQQFDKKREIFVSYKNDPENPASIGNNTVNGITVSSDGTCWLASEAGGGLIKFDRKNGTFENFTIQNKFPTNNIAHIIEDDKGDLWIATSDIGILRYTPGTREYKIYVADEGVMPGQFWASSGLKASDGAIYFGGLNGFNKFYPDQIRHNLFKPPVYFTSLKQGGEEMKPGQAFERVRQIELDWQNNFFEFEFAALNYTLPEKNQYQYILEGHDSEWFDAGTRRFGRYSGLKEGMYILKIRGSNNDGVWSDKMAALNVYVRPHIIEGAQVFTFDEIRSGQAADLRFDENTLMFEAAPLDYSIIENKNYCYMLEGYDNGWMCIASSRYIPYKKVSQGRYTFKIRNSKTNEEYAISITIHPPFYRSWWFLSMTGLGMILLGGVFYTQRIAHLKQEIRHQKEKQHIEKEKAVLENEMALARKIQTALLPRKMEHEDFEIEAVMLPADQVGGDFYDILQGKEDELWLGIGDVSGHGLTPGLIMMMAQTAHTTLITHFTYTPREVVVIVNNILYKNVHERLKETHFMTFTALKYLGDGRFQHAGAHLSMIVFRQKTGACERIRTRGVYLNFKKNISKATKNDEFVLEPGDVLVLYTDGLTEAENPDGKMLDIDGFVEIVEKHVRLEPEAMKERIMADVLEWCDNKRDDDMTLVIVKRKEGVG